MDKLNLDDIGLLLQALDALDKAPGADRALESLMTAMLCRNKEEANSMLQKSEKARAAQEPQVRRRRDFAALVRAKLILQRQALESAEAERAWDESQK